ncbi:efflux RND transporter periplasmic adaptor subunit [Moritella sp. Urea-trap-13]|uniref:efflux RND transporter periplasmic adaptor subunit n=1 Tax=Moritella sp. Urea-trap-13 TaxID=2058327 RepID=UPI000C331431|nr:efflux RND transporter periplasmic adaptor subunit [Moritella sp. Urea-trap-13]PKH06022.1 efflux RND transporter periplasmic adaptor subunit [Moritella sp. Urea-trap-13]
MNLYIKTIVLFTFAAVISGCSAESKEPLAPSIRPVKLLTIADMQTGSIRRFPAKVTATEQANLAFRLPGQLVEFSLIEGQHVNKGAVLARLDDRDARNTLLHREAEHELAAADFKRKGKLRDTQLLSQAEYDLAKAQLKSAQAALFTARDQLSYTVLNAPYSGTIAKISADNYQMVQANQTLLVLQQDRNIDIVIQVSETLATRVTQLTPGTTNQAQVIFSAQPHKSYPVTLKEYATQITPGTQSYEVVFTLPQPSNNQILPGMSAELTLNMATTKQTVAILPTSAVMKRDTNGQSIIWLYNSGTHTVTPQTVTLGKVRSQGIEITSGIKTGDQVVTAGIQQLSAGLVVKPLHWQRGV